MASAIRLQRSLIVSKFRFRQHSVVDRSCFRPKIIHCHPIVTSALLRYNNPINLSFHHPNNRLLATLTTTKTTTATATTTTSSDQNEDKPPKPRKYPKRRHPHQTKQVSLIETARLAVMGFEDDRSLVKVDPAAHLKKASIDKLDDDDDDVVVSMGNDDNDEIQKETTKHRMNVPTTEEEIDSLESRARVKLLALSYAKERAAVVAKEEEDKFVSGTTEKVDFNTATKDLSHAYAQAVRYVARTAARKLDAAASASDLLNEMIAAGIGISVNQLPQSSNSKSGKPLKPGTTSKALRELIPPGGQEQCSDDDAVANLPDLSLDPEIFVPPSIREFNSVVRAWSVTKTKQKGYYAEMLLLRMSQLAWRYPKVFDYPTSRTFSLVAKCYAGSTREDALESILELHKTHNSFAVAGIAGIVRDDPFFLLQSFKVLKDYSRPKQRRLAYQWLERLHSFIIDPTNNNYHGDNASESATTEDKVEEDNPSNQNTSPEKVDLTGTYTTIIREYARLGGDARAAKTAGDVLNKMHEIANKEKEGSTNVGTVQIKANAYNLVLGSYASIQKKEYTSKALKLLNLMVEAWHNRHLSDDDSTMFVPFPTEQSFELCMDALAYRRSSEALPEAQRLLVQFENCFESDTEGLFIPSTKVYDAFLELNIKLKRNQPDLLMSIKSTVERMKSQAKNNNNNNVHAAGVEPSVETWSKVLKACSMVTGNGSEKENAFSTAIHAYEQGKSDVSSNGEEDTESTQMTDYLIYQMMMCVQKLCADQDERRERILDLFHTACQKGLVNANILNVFKSEVPGDVFAEKVGSGRLPKKWIANVKSVKALYTDGTTGGAGKHSRRKGKSTSDWAKKQRKREEERKIRAETKAKKRLVRKLEKKISSQNNSS